MFCPGDEGDMITFGLYLKTKPVKYGRLASSTAWSFCKVIAWMTIRQISISLGPEVIHGLLILANCPSLWCDESFI